MASYSVAETRSRIADLIDRAEAGETITITRRGKPVADLTPRREAPAKRIDLEWIRQHRAYPNPPIDDDDGVHWIERMRDEDGA